MIRLKGNYVYSRRRIDEQDWLQVAYQTSSLFADCLPYLRRSSSILPVPTSGNQVSLPCSVSPESFLAYTRSVFFLTTIVLPAWVMLKTDFRVHR